VTATKPTRTFADAQRWSEIGTRIFLSGTATLSSAAYTKPTGLPGWTRQHLVAHVAANADALGNLVHWAASGERTPMYATREERAEGIARGPRLSDGELGDWLRRSTDRLAEATAALTDEQWTNEVVTAQGRSVPASEIWWMRSREVCVHAVDLGVGIGFGDLPEDFLLALEADVLGKRGEVPQVEGPLAGRVAWLTGRPHVLADAPQIGPWL
jgi:maleylpyruvate isomerase